MTQDTTPCPIAQWLAAVGYTGATRGAMATLYPEDVAKLSKAVDAKVKLACATVQARYVNMLGHQQRSITIQQQTIDAQAAHISHLKAEIASLRGGGTVAKLHERLADIFEHAATRQEHP